MAKYWAVMNAEKTHIQLDTNTNQLEIYESEIVARAGLWPGQEAVEVAVSVAPTPTGNSAGESE